MADLRDVHGGIDVIGEVFRRYFNLFTASSMLRLEPTIAYDWMAVFQMPWMPDGWSDRRSAGGDK